MAVLVWSLMVQLKPNVDYNPCYFGMLTMVSLDEAGLEIQALFSQSKKLCGMNHAWLSHCLILLMSLY